MQLAIVRMFVRIIVAEIREEEAAAQLAAPSEAGEPAARRDESPLEEPIAVSTKRRA